VLQGQLWKFCVYSECANTLLYNYYITSVSVQILVSQKTKLFRRHKKHICTTVAAFFIVIFTVPVFELIKTSNSRISFFKSFLKVVLLLLTRFCNLHLRMCPCKTSYLDTCLWSGNITTIFKKGSKLEPGNYKPVSLTCICCKIMESIIRQSITDHFIYFIYIIMRSAINNLVLLKVDLLSCNYLKSWICGQNR